MGASGISRTQGLNTARCGLMLCASATALLLTAAPSWAQSDTENVVVSASRITAAGFNAPTPTTVLSAQDIESQAQSNVFSAIQQLPSLMGSTGTQVANNTTSINNTGLSAFALHGLGAIRTLTLLNSQRVVPAFVNGTVDISQFPQLLISRVDVVTGGASASWGSDAVGGVVNVIVNDRFEGFKGNILAGVSTYGDDENFTLQLAGGGSFAGGKAHYVLSGEYSYEAGVGPGTYGTGCASGKNGRCWYSAASILQRSIANTAPGQPEYTFATNVQDFQLTLGGLVTRGPLQGTAFAPNGSPYQFQYGSNGVPLHDAAGTVTNCVSPFCIGGDTTSDFGNGTTLAAALQRGNLYAHVSYQLLPNVSVWVGFIGSQVHTVNASVRGAFRPDFFTIQCGNAQGGANAFLPASINTACMSNNITNFRFGSILPMLDNPVEVANQRDLMRYTAGIDGSFTLFGKEWTWNSYLEHGDNNDTEKVRNIVLVPNLNAAVDAVAGPNGSIVCRSTVAQAQGCVPFSPFGTGAVSSSTLSFLQGGQLHQTSPYQQTYERQEAASISFNGQPFDDWAGPVSMAFGAEYREEDYVVYADPAGNGGSVSPLLDPTGNNWFAGNFHSGQGNYHVSEGFLELGIPLMDSATWGKADLNMAGRATGYSTSGYIQTWKVGVTWETPIDGVRLRALQSRDVRAPNLSELFAAPVVSNNSVINPFVNPPTSTNVQFAAVGNTALKPEKSLNTELGIVYQPSWFPGFNLSIDYYHIGIKGQIGSLSAQNEVDLCSQGFTQQCSAIITTNGGPPQTSPFLRILTQSFNLATVVTDGFDYEASYQFSLGDIVPGDFILRALATNVSRFITTSGVPGTIPTETAGTNTGSIPHWKILGVQTYNVDNWSFTFTENWISQGVFNRNYVLCSPGTCPLPTTVHPTIAYNHVDGAFYLNIGGSYSFDDHWQAYFKVDNVANLDPPPSPGTTPNQYGANPSLYDTIGRMFRVGMRVNY
ncbi:MAG TPA: TonB-dependent receptor [Rhizomicrobium sp.]|nr:TonB-dependent receptor [Rhizomicrobium sp.]